MEQGRIHLLVGPVGAGKTTYARGQAVRCAAVFLDVDTWMVRLFGADPRPPEGVMAWYVERRERCRQLMWDLTLSVLDCGTDVFLELGLLSAQEREGFYERADAQGYALQVYLVDAPRDVRRERVARRNASQAPFTQIVPLAFFERASDAWEPPSAEERLCWGILDV